MKRLKYIFFSGWMLISVAMNSAVGQDFFNENFPGTICLNETNIDMISWIPSDKVVAGGVLVLQSRTDDGRVINNPSDFSPSGEGFGAGVYTLRYFDDGNISTGQAIQVGYQNFTINTAPSVDVSPLTVCNGVETEINIMNTDSAVQGQVSFFWSITATNNATGAIEQAQEDPNDLSDDGKLVDADSEFKVDHTLSLISPGAGWITYQMRAVSKIGQCISAAQIVTINVSQTPDIGDIAVPNPICGTGTTNIALTNPNSTIGTRYFWTVPANSVGATNQDPDDPQAAIQQPLDIGASTTPVSVVYTVTPTVVFNNNRCDGTSKDVTVTLKPVPELTVDDQEYCGGDVMLEINSNIGLPTTFSWAGNTNTNIGLGATGTDQSLAVTLINTTDPPSNIIGTLSGVTALVEGCRSNEVSFNITVLSTPNITKPNDFELCNNEELPEITFSSTPTTAALSWQNDQKIGGAARGNGGTIPAFMVSNPSINGAIEEGIITLFADNGQECIGTAQIKVTVYPTPSVREVTPNAQVLCHGAITEDITFTSIPETGASFAWSREDNLGDIGGDNSGTTSRISSFSVMNTGSNTIAAFYNAVVTVNGCASPQKKFSITVHPLPDVIAEDQTICSGASVNIPLSSSVAGTKFTWIPVNPDLGEANLVPSDGPINQKLTLPQGEVNQIQAAFTISPTASNCEGASGSVSVNILPAPVATATAIPDIICHGETTRIELSSNIAGSTFEWTVKSQKGVAGPEPSQAPSVGPIENTLLLTSGVAGAVVYSVLATSPDPARCPGITPTDVEVGVRGKPIILDDIGSMVYCEGANVTLSVKTASASDQFVWYVLPSTRLEDIGAYSGTNSSTLFITDIDDSFSGNQYQVIITDAACPDSETVSNVATLTSQFFGTEAITSKTNLTYGEKVNFITYNPPEGGEYRWEFGDQWYSEEISPVHYYYAKGVFQPTLTIFVLKTQCSKEFTLPAITVNGLPSDGDIITSSEDLLTGFSVFPNPILGDQIKIASPHPMRRISLVNMSGSSMFEIICAGEREFTVNVPNLSAGLYIMLVEHGGGVDRVKLIKK